MSYNQRKVRGYDDGGPVEPQFYYTPPPPPPPAPVVTSPLPVTTAPAPRETPTPTAFVDDGPYRDSVDPERFTDFTPEPVTPPVAPASAAPTSPWEIDAKQFNDAIAGKLQYNNVPAGSVSLTLANGRVWTPSGAGGGITYHPADPGGWIASEPAEGGTTYSYKAPIPVAYYEVNGDLSEMLGTPGSDKHASVKYTEQNGKMVPMEQPHYWNWEPDTSFQKALLVFGAAVLGAGVIAELVSTAGAASTAATLESLGVADLAGGLSSTAIASAGSELAAAGVMAGGEAAAATSVAGGLATTAATTGTSGLTLSGILSSPGAAIGNALGITNPYVAQMVGNTIIQTATNGGDVGKALESAALSTGLSFVGSSVSGAVTDALKTVDLPDIVKKGISQGVSGAVTATATGQSPLSALAGAAMNTAVNGVIGNIPGLSDLPPEAQSVARAAITAKLTGTDITDAALAAALAEGKRAVAGYVDTAAGLAPKTSTIPAANPLSTDPSQRGSTTDGVPTSPLPVTPPPVVGLPPVDTGSLPVTPTPPADVVGLPPVDTGSLPVTPTPPAEVVPTPAEVVPTPAEVVPTPAEVVPTPAEVVPTPAEVVSPTLEESLGPNETVVPPVETTSDRIKKDFEKLIAEGVGPALALRLAMEGVSTAPVPAPAPAPVDTYTRPDDDYYVAPVPVGDSLDPGEEVLKSEFEDLKPVAQTGGLPVDTDPVTTALGQPDISEEAVADILGTAGQTASNSLENGTQLAAVDTGTVSDAGGGGGYLPFSVDVKGIPIYAESSLASTITPPSGYTLLSTEKADNKPFGSYYDAELNAWLTPLAPDDYAYPSEGAPFDATTYTAPDDYAYPSESAPFDATTYTAPDDYVYPSESAPFDATTYTAPDNYVYPSESAPFDATTYTAPDDYVYPSESAPFDATTYTRPDDNYYTGFSDLPLTDVNSWGDVAEVNTDLSDLPLTDVNSWGDVASVNTDVLTRPDDDYYYEDLPPLSELPLTDVGSPGLVTGVIADTPAPVDTGGGGALKVTVKPTVKPTVTPTVTGGGGLPTSSYSDQTAVGGNLLRVGKMGQDMSRHELKQLYDNLVTNSSPNYGYVNDVNPEMVDILKANTLPFSAPQPNYSAYTGYAQGGPVQNLADGAQPDQSYAVRDTMAALKGLGALGFDGKPERPMLLKQGQMGGAHNSKVLPQLAALLRARGMTLAEGGQPDDHTHPNYDGMPLLRTGGLSGLGGKYVEGKGDGTSDDIAAMLANGEYVFSADVVAALGNGSNKAGAEELDRMVQAIRSRARSAPPDKLPPDAKSPLEYLKSSKGKKHG